MRYCVTGLATLTGTVTSQQRRPEMTRSEFSTGLSGEVNDPGNHSPLWRILEPGLLCKE